MIDLIVSLTAPLLMIGGLIVCLTAFAIFGAQQEAE